MKTYNTIAEKKYNTLTILETKQVVGEMSTAKLVELFLVTLDASTSCLFTTLTGIRKQNKKLICTCQRITIHFCFHLIMITINLDITTINTIGIMIDVATDTVI